MQMGVGIRQSIADTDSLLSQNWPPSPPVHWRSCSETDSATTEKHGRKKTEKTAQNATEFLISVDLGKVWPPLPQTVPSNEEKKSTTPFGTAPFWTLDQQPLIGTIVSPYFPPIKERIHLPLGPLDHIFPPVPENKSPNSFEFPMVSTSMQNYSPSRLSFPNSGVKDAGALPMHNTSAPVKSFPNVSWKPKEPQVFLGKGNGDIH